MIECMLKDEDEEKKIPECWCICIKLSLCIETRNYIQTWPKRIIPLIVRVSV